MLAIVIKLNINTVTLCLTVVSFSFTLVGKCTRTHVCVCRGGEGVCVWSHAGPCVDGASTVPCADLKFL